MDLSRWEITRRKESHGKNLPRGYEHIVDDEPDYGGFLRGRVASNFGPQLIVVYCRPESLAEKGEKLRPVSKRNETNSSCARQFCVGH
ncbi:MAG: hypothetical protein IPH52_11815 [Leptospiraceae bacterium]|nr:hypothetical protein [Leptospiraceae bacterium]